jgi:hypothetical protein
MRNKNVMLVVTAGFFLCGFATAETKKKIEKPVKGIEWFETKKACENAEENPKGFVNYVHRTTTTKPVPSGLILAKLAHRACFKTTLPELGKNFEGYVRQAEGSEEWFRVENETMIPTLMPGCLNPISDFEYLPDPVGARGFSGIQGDKGEKGDKGDTPTDEHLKEIIRPLVAETVLKKTETVAKNEAGASVFERTGCILNKGGYTVIVDQTGNQVFELRGMDFRKVVGNTARISGNASPFSYPGGGASQVVLVTKAVITRKGGCAAVAAKIGATTTAHDLMLYGSMNTAAGAGAASGGNVGAATAAGAAAGAAAAGGIGKLAVAVIVGGTVAAVVIGAVLVSKGGGSNASATKDTYAAGSVGIGGKVVVGPPLGGFTFMIHR